MYDSVNGKEGIVFTGKTDDFVSYIKEWKKLDELQLDKYKNVKAERLDSKYQAYDMILWLCQRNSVYGILPWNCILSNDGKLFNV